jgi:hypothetical protein
MLLKQRIQVIFFEILISYLKVKVKVKVCLFAWEHDDFAF